MTHFQSFLSRRVLLLPQGEANGWKLKRYGIVANDREYDSGVAKSALYSAIEQLPISGQLADPEGNHGVGFQIVHFAEVAVVSPVFYWMWGSVLANTNQMRAHWNNANAFETGVKEVIGCVWELEIVCFETTCWKEAMLSGGEPTNNLARYLESYMPSVESIL